MNIKAKIFSGVALTVGLMLTTACSNDFFEQYPSNNVTEGNFYQTDNDFNQGVRGCYHRVKSGLSFHLNELAYRSDESELKDMAVSTQDRYDFDHFTVIANNGLLSTLWKNTYNGIYRCNDLLLHLDGKSGIANANRYRGETLFIRSWHYFTLYRVFGVVPLTRTAVAPAEAKNVARCTEADMYDLLVTDLTQSAELLSDKPDSEKARVTSMAALTLLAKVHLTFGHKAEAKTVLEKAMTNPNYGMETSTARVFDTGNKMNKEIIFALYYNKTNDSGHGYWFGSSTNVEADIKNPTMLFKSIYDNNDNRYGLLANYTKVGNVYIMQKWYDTYDATYTTVVGNDFPHLRYADVVLMYAEAVADTDMTTALDYLNMTRARAGLSNLTSSDVPDKATFVKELAAERGREFALEGQRWFDLVRLGLAVEYFRSLGYTLDDTDLLFPIPNDQIEITNNSAILWQNPGY
ncbi:MAG: RagB/SusD family nutrient uptake outer membrane protein [Muribaculaceae bacterium]|nr:RagB/SusD family nutrient uptake outer membrane protein [Muribaculaceae bacterium]